MSENGNGNGGMKVSLDTALKIVTAIVLVVGLYTRAEQAQKAQGELIVTQGKLILQQGERIESLTREMALMREDVNEWKRATTGLMFRGRSFDDVAKR